ncbi:metal ABC transporter permease [Pallidibacillus thermolactis]|jgi:zinc transport system permease protein|uniref:metal ABC transporter permease n=1 Tax=Pallidibacillus thermolactis TaxID=251051 RepID=UPI00156B3961|nr:metal ABC transporter permease [Pallidibacillus thermolactis]MCU9600535.1 metal ABC transporter permease [Pallidibacillus thermolactis subsp. kokeshiiformis]
MFHHIFQYEFLQNSFLTGMLIGIIAPLLGVFIVVRKLSLIADALSHISLSGIAATMLAATYSPILSTISPLYGGMLFSVIGALSIEKLRSVYKHFEELAIPIIMSIGIGLGVIFISLADGFNQDLFGYLFGSVSAVGRTDLFSIFIIGLLVVLTIFFVFKELFLLAFDEEFGKAQGIRSSTVHFIFIILVALVIAISIRIVGVLLVSSLMTLPVAASMRVSKSFKQTIIFSIIFGEVAVVGGLISAFYLDLAPGGTIVCILAIILIITILFSKKFKYNER